MLCSQENFTFLLIKAKQSIELLFLPRVKPVWHVYFRQMQVVARRKIRKKHALPGDTTQFSKVPGDKRSPTITSNCEWERLRNSFVTKEHSDYERPRACHHRCSNWCINVRSSIQSLSYETWKKEQRKTEHPAHRAMGAIIHASMICLCQHHSKLLQKKAYHNQNQYCSVLCWRRNLAIRCM